MEEKKCKECGKTMTSYNHGKYCFACNARCVQRDDEIIEDAERLIKSTKAKIKFMKNPKCIAREIIRLERLIKTQLSLIEKVKN